MGDFSAYLSSVKVRAGIKNERELAARIGVSQAYINNLFRGINQPSDDLVIKIAALVGDDPAKALLLAHASKASEKTRPIWEKIIKSVAAAAMCLAFLLPSFTTVSATGDTMPRLYIMLTRTRRRLEMAFSALRRSLPDISPINTLLFAL